MKIRKIAFDSVLAAMCTVLGFVSLNFGSMKLTLESLPVFVGALLFGGVDGALIGTIGTFLYQMLSYGFTVTTVLWVIPYSLCGLLTGLYAKKKSFDLSIRQTVFICTAVNLLLTTLNTAVMYIDSIVFSYYSHAYIFGSLLVRYLVCIGKAVVFGFILPPLVKTLRRIP